MAKNPFGDSKAPPFGGKGKAPPFGKKGKGKPNPFAKKGAAPDAGGGNPFAAKGKAPPFGGKGKPFAKGGSIDGCAKRGHTKA